MTFVLKIEKLCQGLPSQVSQGFLGFCKDYEKACAQAKVDPETLVATFATFLEAVGTQLKSPYPFQPYHTALPRYYELGLDFVRPLIDFAHSKVAGKEQLDTIDKAIRQGENVVLFANHQTEIDPQIISLLIEKEYPTLSREMIFVAGHRVVTDPLAVPLSLGRNLLCIYSKRHIDEPPEKRAEKLAHNQKALKALEERLNSGGACIYIAPSGGRDRQDDKGTIQVAPFDPDSIELFALIAKKAKRKTHFHTLTLKTYALLPPPDHILKEIGEKRTTRFSPAELAFGPEIAMDEAGNVHQIADKKEKRIARARAIWQKVVDDYGGMK